MDEFIHMENVDTVAVRKCFHFLINSNYFFLLTKSFQKLNANFKIFFKFQNSIEKYFKIFSCIDSSEHLTNIPYIIHLMHF